MILTTYRSKQEDIDNHTNDIPLNLALVPFIEHLRGSEREGGARPFAPGDVLLYGRASRTPQSFQLVALCRNDLSFGVY